MATRHGIEYDLRKTPHFVKWCNLTFYFSSAKHMLKFDDIMFKRMDWLNDSMSRRFHVAVDMRELALLQLYMQVETRGFRVTVDPMEPDYPTGGEFDCPESMTLNGLRIRGRGSTQPFGGTTTPLGVPDEISFYPSSSPTRSGTRTSKPR